MPKIKKTKETMTDQILIDPSYVKGHKLIIKKIIKKTYDNNDWWRVFNRAFTKT